MSTAEKLLTFYYAEKVLSNKDGGFIFLKTIYTVTKSVTSIKYQRAVEEEVVIYGGCDRVCAVKSDNTAAFMNDRTLYAEQCSGIVSVNHQTHVAELQIDEAGKLPWLKEFVDVVCEVSSEFHGQRKIKELYRIVVESYNEGISVQDTMLRRHKRHRILKTTKCTEHTCGRP